MPDDNYSNQPNQSQQVTPASNQNLIIGLVMGAAILCLLYLVFTYSGQTKTSSSESQEVAELKRRIEDLRRSNQSQSNEDTQNFGSGTSTFGVDPSKLAEEISVEANTLAGMIGSFANTLREKDALIQTARDRESLLNNQIKDYQRKNLELNELALEATALRKDLDNMRALYENAQRTIEELRKRPDAETLEKLRLQNDDLRARILAFSDMEAENRRLSQEVQRLRALLDRSTLFVESADALPARAQRLFRELERLDDRTPDQLQNEYLKIEQTLQARPLRSISFATGSSQLTNEKIGMIKNDLSRSNPNAFLLVVGYASKVGNPTANRKLSSDRATAVASQVNLDKKPAQDVRAVFLSETNRFSKEQAGPNQICEIWEITL